MRTGWTKRSTTVLVSAALALGLSGVPFAAQAAGPGTSSVAGLSAGSPASALTGSSSASSRSGAALVAQADIDIFENDPNLPPGMINLARGKTAQSSSSYEMSNEGWGTAFVNDGKIGTGTLPQGWSTNPIGNTDTVTTPAWVSLDLLTPSSVSAIALWPRLDGANDGVNFPVDYAVQVSADGVNGNWTTVATKTGNTGVTEAQVVTFEPAQGRFVRVRATKRAPGGADGALVQLGELAVYGTSLGTTVQLDKPALQLLPGESDTLVPTINGLPGDPKTLRWVTSNPRVATVSATGVVTAKSLGSATVTVTREGAKPIVVPIRVIAKRTLTDEEFLSQGSVVIDPVPRDVERHRRGQAREPVHRSGIRHLLEHGAGGACRPEDLEAGPGVAEGPGRQLDRERFEGPGDLGEGRHVALVS